MIAPDANVRVYLACGVTDMRKGIDGLMSLVQSSLRQKPASGSVFAFRGRRGDRIKLLFWDGQGFCLYCVSAWNIGSDSISMMFGIQLAWFSMENQRHADPISTFRSNPRRVQR